MFFFGGEYYPPNPSKHDLEELVKAAGGTVCSYGSTDYTKSTCILKIHKYIILVTTDCFIKTQKNISPYIVLNVSPMWIFNCLSEFKLLM